MNKLQQYEREYADVRSKVRQVPKIDRSLLSDAIRAADVPVEALLQADNDDERRGLTRAATQRLLRYFADSPDRRAPIFDWLSPRDDDPKTGVLLVYGAGGAARPKQAAELYAYAPRPVIVSDGDPAVREKFGRILAERGVQPDDIHYETQARNYLENAYYSLRILRERFSDEAAVIVTESLVARRALVATQMYADGQPLVSYPMLTDEDGPVNDPTSPNNWYGTELGMKLLIGEMAAFALYERFGLIAPA